jgi:hypothetical protein
MPEISSEGQGSCREQTVSRRSAVLDDPQRVAVDRQRQSLTRLGGFPASARHYVPHGNIA